MLHNLLKNQKEAIKYHNQFRSKHLCGPISWDVNLFEQAKNHAKYLASIDRVEHDKKTKDGENIVVMKGGNLSGKAASTCWYNEIRNYRFDNPCFTPNAGHFTQLVWKGSKLFGYGEAKSTNGTVYVVARYSPSGNVDEEFSNNVLPPITSPKMFSASPYPQEMNDDEYSTLEAHNILRTNHGTEPLIWSRELCNLAKIKAKQYSEQKVFPDILIDKEYGENFCTIISPCPDGVLVVESWYEEGITYDYNTHKCSQDSQHFTQIVWKNSSELGLAKVEIEENYWMLVMLYHPRGNIEGEFKENVLAPKTAPADETKDDNIDAISESQKQALGQHNEYRAIHNCNFLEWSIILYEEAFKWAEILIKAEFIKKDDKSQRGENIGFEWESTNNPHNIIKKWYDEGIYYDYSDPRGTYQNNSFTQIIWGATKYIGFASASDSNGLTIYVAKYWPPGNISGLYEENVLPKQDVKIPIPIVEKEYKNWILKYHNIYRKNHRSGKLILSRILCKKAAEIAEFILNIKSDKINYGLSSIEGYKYNYLVSKKTSFPNPKTVCQVWYNTCIYFHYDSEEISQESASFCEMVWKSTHEIGVGISKSEKYSIVIVIYNCHQNSESKVSKNIKRPLERYASLKKK